MDVVGLEMPHSATVDVARVRISAGMTVQDVDFPAGVDTKHYAVMCLVNHWAKTQKLRGQDQTSRATYLQTTR